METMTQRTWTMSGLELTVLWHAIGRDILPYPLQYRPTEPTADAYDRAYKSAAARIQSLFDEDMYGPLRVLVEPEARVEVAGFAAATPPVMPRADADPNSIVRIHAAIAGNAAVLLTQQPTATPNSGGPVRMDYLPARTIAGRIIAALPTAPPGTAAPFHINRADLESPDDAPFTAFRDDTPRPQHTQITRFFERPRTTVTHIAVYPGPAFDNRPTPTRDFHIIDYPEGRYRIRTTASIQSTPTTGQDLTTHLNTLLTRTLEEHREDTNPTYRY
ncbi:ESX secretion-associated protein EspG [Nocardia cyriacigeorgica]|uniref:ESX secretion-associated protein EspG n=1 Tax=Nocardia cyriacigeorgica TaxID=135487 RepID=UPI001892F09F|nr:ESX secretion-associated protein EspG [Nocardia cyriacigeorgica]MBF6097213.1 ESX secretion-associated protein EspG [Nocardia cyriacigeorgica]MBF6160791.1 ESX secretion-associated protein EspG [Nocardia cyriacigeorgica]MBF6201625.1 ESX secretion-associated protein EspG [Nocardia cyriacigeorgica]MBF6395467.1 ESX secretion-associated protein EspG [Nocardia cyriacigeorgica]MBF6401099.1 ESX secretion-associated protein EspG [Nocardia cyriacigeorgica]